MKLISVLWCVVLGMGAARAERTQSAVELAQVRELFTRGNEAFVAGRYEEALRLFEDAAAIRTMPELYYNIGRCHEELRQPQEAIHDFEKFLATHPAAAEEAGVRRKLDSLRAALPRAITTPPPVTTPRPVISQPIARPQPVAAPQPALAAAAPLAAEKAVQSSPRKRPAWMWGLIGGAVAVVAAGVAVGVVLGTRPVDPTPTLGQFALSLP